MRFDASGPVQSAVRRTLSLDPRMIRFSVVKLGDKLEEINDVPGHIDWNGTKTLVTDSIGSRVAPGRVRMRVLALMRLFDRLLILLESWA